MALYKDFLNKLPPPTLISALLTLFVRMPLYRDTRSRNKKTLKEFIPPLTQSSALLPPAALIAVAEHFTDNASHKI